MIQYHIDNYSNKCDGLFAEMATTLPPVPRDPLQRFCCSSQQGVESVSQPVESGLAL